MCEEYRLIQSQLYFQMFENGNCKTLCFEKPIFIIFQQRFTITYTTLPQEGYVEEPHLSL